MKKKKIIIIALIVLALIIAGLLLYFLVFKDKGKDNKPKPTNNVVEKITIKFDTDGGEKVEDIKINKKSSTELPVTSKDGYMFEGWYLEDEKVDEEYIFNKDVTLKAKWEEIEEDEKVMKITFDSKGGSKVNSLTIKCKDDVAIIENLPKTTKDAYNFLSWADKNGKPILNGAKLTCSDELKLYATWEYDGPVANPDTNPKYFTVTFDSTGGNKIDPVKVECGKTLTLPKLIQH